MVSQKTYTIIISQKEGTMKKIVLLLPIIILLLSCVENKPVIEKLKLEDVSKLIKQDSLYENIILEVDTSRYKFDNNIVLMSKFKLLTYSEYLSYKKNVSCPVFLNGINTKADSLYQLNLNKQMNIYKPIIDSSLIAYRIMEDDNDPEKYFKAEFSSIEKKYYDYSAGVESINIKFKITPLQGDIQGGAFSYNIIPNVTNIKVAGGSCRFSTFTFTDEIYTWEAPYDVEDEFENASTSSIIKNYRFEFSYLTVRKNNETLSTINLFTIIPLVYQIYLDQDSLGSWAYKYIMESEFDVVVKPSYEIADKILKKEKQAINALAFEFESITIEK